MKKILAFVAAGVTLLSVAQAQTVINGVVISHGQQPTRVQVVPARVVTTQVTRTVPVHVVTTTPAHAPTRTVAVTSAPTTPGTRTVPAFVDSAVPADWIDIRGRVSMGAQRVRLPQGSQVNVSLLDLNRGAPRTLITANFTTRHLPSSYQLVSSPRRFNRAGRYAVQAVVVSSDGNTLYKSSLYTINPAAKRILADITVR